MDLRPGESFGRSIISHYGIRWQQNLVNSFIYVRVSYLATLEWSGFLPGSSLSPLALKQQQTITFHLWLAVVLWQLHGPTSGTPALHCFIYWDVGEPMQDHFLQLGVTWDTFYLRELLCHREEVLSVMRIVFFWKRSVSLSSLGVFLCCVCLGCVCVWGLFCFRLWKTPGFLLFTCSLTTWE